MTNDMIDITHYADLLRDTDYLAIVTDTTGTYLTTSRPTPSQGTTCLCYYNEGNCPVCDN